MYVTDADHRAGLALVAEVAESASRSAFAQSLIQGAHRLLGSDEVSFSELRLKPTPRFTRLEAFPTSPSEIPSVRNRLVRCPMDHPVVRRWSLSGPDTALRLSDMYSCRELDRLPFFHEFFVPRRVRFADYVVIDRTPTGLVALGLGRGSRDFTDAEHDAIEHLRRPLAAVFRLVVEREAVGKGVVGKGTAGKEAVGKGVVGNDLESATVPDLRRLTVSEAEVVRLVLRGMRNSAIAEQLRVSTKAVEQHLTRAYRKLSVSSRTELVIAVGGTAGKAGVSPIAERRPSQ